MTGTLVNVAAVIAGSLIGTFLKKGFNEKINESITYMLGISTVLIGINGVLSVMVSVDTVNGKISTSGELLLLVSLAVGATIGEVINIEEKLNSAAEKVENRLGTSDMAKGFVSGSLLFCVGAMAIVGSISDGLSHDSSILIVKSALDFIASIIIGSSTGIGVAFSALTVFVYQGAITAFAGLLEPVLKGPLLDNVCMVGYAIVICIGVNFFGRIKIRTGNLVPALLIPVVYQIVTKIITIPV